MTQHSPQPVSPVRLLGSLRAGTGRLCSALAASVVLLASLSGGALAAAPGPRPVAADIDEDRTDEAPVEVGRFPRFPDTATALEWFPGYSVVKTDGNSTAGIPHLNAAARRMYQFYDLTNGPQGNRIGVLIRDLDTYRPVSTFVFQPGLIPGNQAMAQKLYSGDRGQVIHAFDQQRQRFIIAVGMANSTSIEQFFLVIHEDQLEARKGAKVEPFDSAVEKIPFGLQATDMTGYPGDDPLDLPQLGDPRLAHFGAHLRGMSYVDGRIYVVKGPEASVQPEFNFRLTVAQINPDTFVVEWARTVRSCEGPGPEGTSSQFSGWVPVIKTAGALIVPCTISRNIAIVEMPLDSVADPEGTETVYRANGNPAGYLYDQAGERLHIRVRSTAQSIVSFDVPHRAFVGQKAVAQPAEFRVLGVGIDSASGRVYGLGAANQRLGGTEAEPEALTFLDGRATPIEPPKRYAFHQSNASDNNRWRVLPRDEIAGVLFVPSPDLPKDSFVIALKDAPPAEEVDLENPDLKTKNVKERSGRTDALKSSESSAYGLRTFLVRGVAGFGPGRVYDAAGPDDHLTDPKFDRCQADTRVVTLARVEKVGVQGALQTAQATPIDVDAGTITDLERPSRCTIPPRPGTKVGLDPVLDQAETAACVDSATTANSALEELAGVAPWLPSALGQSLPDGIDDPLIGEGGSLGVPPPCDAARAQLDQQAGREWPFSLVSCSPGGPPVTRRPGTSLADPADVVADPGAFAEDPERLAPNPERAALGDFSASAECQTKSGASASAAAQPPSTETLARVLPESPAPGAPDPTTVAAGLPSVVVSHTSASTGYRIDPERGTVARAEALVRGISITIPAVGGQPAIVIRIDGAYSLAESAAKGVPGTTGTVHRRVLWGVHIAGGGQHFERELCATEECLFQARDALNQLLGDRGRARVPTAEPALSAGSPGGYTAAVQMEKFEAINRSVVDGDSAKEVPVMDIVLFNDSLVAGKQRQIIQLAGVKTNSQYGIFCLGGGTVQDGECVLPVVPGGSITVSLTDDEGTPLPGAEFQAAGAERAACTTDGEGRCHMIDLKPGTYTVTETTPPPDYAPAAPLRVQVRSGSAASATFVNFRGVGYIEISLSDAVSGAPLAGGTFEVQSGGNPFVKCTTNRAGLCEFVISGGREANEVPLGQYAVRQLTAPKGYEPISDPTSVSLTKPQQVARLPYTNGPAGGVDADVLGGIEGPATLAPVAATDGGGLGGLFDALDDLGQWIRRNPGEALMFASSLALFASPFWASWRRRLLLGIPRRPGT